MKQHEIISSSRRDLRFQLFDDAETINFKSVFAKAVIVDKGLTYFVIENGDMKNLPLRTKLYFKSLIEYKIRKSVFTTQLGIIIK